MRVKDEDEVGLAADKDRLKAIGAIRNRHPSNVIILQGEKAGSSLWKNIIGQHTQLSLA